MSFFANEAESLLLPGTELEVLSCERRWPVGEEGALWMRQHEVRKMDESKNMTHSSERGPLCGPHAAAISAVLSEISIAADGGVVWQNPTKIFSTPKPIALPTLASSCSCVY